MSQLLPRPLREAEALGLVAEYFKASGFECAKIDPSILPEGQESPDFEVFKDGKRVAYAELKSVEHRLDKNTGMFLWRTLFNKLKDRSSKAANQLSKYNPSEQIPRIVIFNSNYFQLNWIKFAYLLQGAVGGNSQIIKSFRENTGYIEDIKRKIKQVDGFIWIQTTNDHLTIHQVAFYINQKSKILNLVSEIILGLLPVSLSRVKCTKIHSNCKDPSHYIFRYDPEDLKLMPW